MIVMARDTKRILPPYFSSDETAEQGLELNGAQLRCRGNEIRLCGDPAVWRAGSEQRPFKLLRLGTQEVCD